MLRDAILRDVLFLESKAVMDYSLLVGLDSKQNVLVLGIIGKTTVLATQRELNNFMLFTSLQITYAPTRWIR